MIVYQNSFQLCWNYETVLYFLLLVDFYSDLQVWSLHTDLYFNFTLAQNGEQWFELILKACM